MESSWYRMSIIYGSGNDLLSLINEILDLSKIEAGKLDLEMGRVSLRQLAEATETTFRHMAEQKGLALNIAVAESVPEEVVSNRQRLDQVLRNLISNSIKFTDRGSITVEIGRPAEGADLSRSHLNPADTLAIAVTDTGIGIPPDKQKVIFEAFQQADGGTARKYGGTGLGLSITRELVRLLGGEIQLKSEEGKGSTFTVFLPTSAGLAERGTGSAERGTAAGRAETADGSASPRSELRPSTGSGQSVPSSAAAPRSALPVPSSANAESSANGGRSVPDDREGLNGDGAILIIEDDANFAKVLTDYCHQKGMKCLAAPSGEEGLKLAERHSPRGIILDIRLPGMDGWAVLDALKENPNTRHIPVHIMSVEEPTMEALKRGPIGYLTKPATGEALDEALGKLEQAFSKSVKELLVVEDDEILRRNIVEVIGDGDVRSDAASDGAEAIQKLSSRRYDCMILDLGLPDMTGFQLLKTLRGMDGMVIPPVIVYTGRDLTREENEELSAYAESIIIKGVRSEERLLDEASLFLHRVVADLPEKKRQIITDLHDTDTMFRDRRVLVVDDDMRNVFALSKALGERGMQTLKAEDGRKALELLDEEKGRVDLVLMDIMMPVMDGYETMQQIRSQERFRALPIIALTAKAMKEDRDRCIRAGASDYLTKPVDVQRLLSMMRVWLYR